MADIRGGARLKKVSDTEKKDRSAAAIPGGEPAASSPAPAAGGGGDGGGLAGALANALAARKSKVSHSGKSGISILSKASSTDIILQMMKMTRMIGRFGVCRGSLLEDADRVGRTKF